MSPSPEVKKGILIVEDENIVALDMKYRLEAFGYSILAVVANGEAALRSASELKPDLVLMDISLKGPMDGIETARRMGGLVESPIVFVTAYTDEATLDKVKRSDAYGYIVKPYNERELRIAIELALSKHKYEKGLRLAKEAAEASDRAKTRFLSNISHELKTPLNAIMGFVDLAASLAGARAGPSQDERSGEIAEYMAFAKRGARKLETIIDSILDYTKLEFGALAPIEDEFELEAFLAACWLPFARDAEAKGVTPRLYLDPDLPRLVRGDEGKLRTIVMNLIDNAVKFTDSGYALLSAERVAGEAGGARAIIRVADTGRGMTPAELSTAFSPFTQVDDSTTRAAGGLGLGLTVAKGLSELLKIGFGYSSEPGRGSAFEFSLPLSDERPRFASMAAGRKARLGAIGTLKSEADLARWAPRLGFELGRYRPGDGGAAFDAAIVDAEAWGRLDDASRRAAERLGLILIGDPDRDDGCEDWLSRLPSPPLASSLAEAISALMRGEAGSAGAAANGERVSAAGGCAEPLGGQGLRDYARLSASAEEESASMGLSALLGEFRETVRASAEAGGGEPLERLVKASRDRFADLEAMACANLALAVLMDVRAGQIDGLGAAIAPSRKRGS